MNDWEKELEDILKDFEREFDRCGGNYKYNRKPVINKLVKLLTKERLKMAKALRMKEWKAEVIGNVTDHVNILIRKQNQKLDSYLKKQEGK